MNRQRFVPIEKLGAVSGHQQSHASNTVLGDDAELGEGFVDITLHYVI